MLILKTITSAKIIIYFCNTICLKQKKSDLPYRFFLLFFYICNVKHSLLSDEKDTVIFCGICFNFVTIVMPCCLGYGGAPFCEI